MNWPRYCDEVRFIEFTRARICSLEIVGDLQDSFIRCMPSLDFIQHGRSLAFSRRFLKSHCEAQWLGSIRRHFGSA